MKKSPIPTILTVAYIAFLSYLKKDNEKISGFLFITLALTGTLLIQMLYYRFVSSKKISKIKELNKHAELLRTNPSLYLEEIDKLLLESNGFEREYLTLHKANVLTSLGRNSDAIDILKGTEPNNLDIESKGLYFGNLLGLYLQENRIEEAKNLYHNEEMLFKKMEKNSRIAYSVLINRAVLYYREGDLENANLYLDRAKKVSRKEMNEEIEKIREKFI